MSTFDLPSCREGGLADQLEGSAVRYVGVPQDLSELCGLMGIAHARDLVLLPRGGGSKLFWLDLPPMVDILLDLSAFVGRRYDAETACVTVGAGTRLDILQAELSAHGRRLACDAPSAGATAGGVMVTGETGPLGHWFGPPATLLTDATVVLPDGTVAGVADRVRLLGGSVCDLRWAYPGWPHPACVVVDMTLQTHPLPEARQWLTFPLSEAARLADLREEVMVANVSPAAVEIDLPGRRGGCSLSLLFEGSAASVHDRARELARRLGLTDSQPSGQPPAWWGRYPFRAGDIAVRLHTPDGHLHAVYYAMAEAIGGVVPVRGSAGSGLGWARLPGDLPATQLMTVLEMVREILLARGGTAVVQAAPHRLKEVVAPYRHP